MTLSAVPTFAPPLVMPEAIMPSDPRAVQLGRFVKEKRLDLGLNRPAFVREMARQGREITPDYLNKLESGAVSLARASLEVRDAIAAVLGYSAAEWQEATGLYKPVEAARGAASAPPSLPIPEALAEAAHQYGGEFASPAWQKYLAELPFRDGRPETADDWYFLYRSFLKLGVGPEPKN